MRVIDVDSHFLEPVDWLQQVDPGLAAEIPPADPIERIVQGVVGDLLEVVPRSQRPVSCSASVSHPSSISVAARGSSRQKIPATEAGVEGARSHTSV